MVSRYKRHLSLFLVILLTMGWFVDPNYTPIAFAQDNPLEVAPVGFKISSGYQFSYFNEASQPKTSVTFTWIKPNSKNTLTPNSVVTHFDIQYLAKSAVPTGMSTDLCRSSFAPWQTVPKGIDLNDSDPNATTTRITVNNARDVTSEDVYFRLTAKKVVITEKVGVLTGTRVKNIRPVPLMCGKDPLIANSALSCPADKIKTRFTSTPEGASVTVNGLSLQTFVSQNKSTTNVTICTTKDTSPKTYVAEFKLTGYKTSTIKFTLTTDNLLNAPLVPTSSKENPTATVVQNPGTGTDAGGTKTTGATAVAEYFVKISGKDVVLSDDPTDKTDTNNDKVIDPIKAPIVTMSKSNLNKMPEDLVFRLTNLVRSAEVKSPWHWGTNNNYFLFKMENLTKAQSAELKKNNVDPALTYLAIDMSGNVGILVDDPSKDGGMLTNGKATFNEGNNQFIAIGEFNGNIHDGKTVSKNIAGEALDIDFDQYRTFITKRVYNDANPATGASTAGFAPSDTGCVAATPIHYPNVNTSYEADSSRFPSGIPVSTYRKCINIDPEGWLMKWGVKDTRLDQVPADECVRAFGGGGGFLSFVTDTVAKSLCFMLGAIINAATWTAGFSVDFMIKAIGLQIR